MADSRVMLWDFDGTLAWRNGMWRGCLIEALTEIAPGHQLELDDLRTGLRGGFPWHRPDEQHVHLASPGAWWAALTPMLTRAYRLAGIDPRTAAAAADIVPTHFLNPPAWTVFPDTRPALTRLRDNGWRHVIVSNHVPELPQLVDALGIGDLFDDVMTSAAVGWEKPNPAIFEAALRRAGRPDSVFMVGDNPEVDIAGAIRVGIPALLVRTPAAADGVTLDLHGAADRVLAGGT